MKRVLVTGGAGFIGRRTLPKLLERGYEVHATFLGTEPRIDRVQWHAVDLLQSSACSALVQRLRPSHLLHLAWYVDAGTFWTAPENLSWVAATLELTRMFHAAGGERATYAGTCAEYDWSYGFCSERVTPLAPATLYGAAKAAAAGVIAAFAAQYGLSHAWGRVFHLYGPDEDARRLVGSVMRALLEGRVAPTSAGLQIRDFLHVDDVAAALVAGLDSDLEGPFNIGSGVPTRVREIVEVIGECVGRPELLRVGALPTSRTEPPLLVADVRRLGAEIGFRPAFDLRSGIAACVRELRANATYPSSLRRS